MPAMTNILVKDDTITTPVEFTLIPVTDTPSPIWRANVAGVPISGQLRATMSSESFKKGGKLVLKVESPVMETLGASGTSAGYVAPPRVAYTNTLIMTMFYDERSTSQDRANLLKIGIGIAQGASSTTATGVLANTAAGNAFVNSALPGPQLFTTAIVPN